MPMFYNPSGKIEVHKEKPEGYYTVAEWGALSPKPEVSLEYLKAEKMAEITRKYIEHDRISKIETSADMPIQTGRAHCTNLAGAIQYAEMAGQSSMYITDAENVTHFDVPIGTAKQILLEQMAAATATHALKQQLRTQVAAAGTVEELGAVEIGF